MAACFPEVEVHHAPPYVSFVSGKNHPKFKNTLTRLMLISRKNRTKKRYRHACRRLMYFLLLLRGCKLIILSIGYFLQWIKLVQQGCASSKFTYSLKQVIVLPATRSILSSLQRGILKIEQKKKVCAQLTDTSLFKKNTQTHQFLITAIPTILPLLFVS